MMRDATQPIAQGMAATTRRSANPQVTTLGPDSQRMRRTGGTLRRARMRSPHALWEPELPLPLLEGLLQLGHKWSMGRLQPGGKRSRQNHARVLGWMRRHRA